MERSLCESISPHSVVSLLRKNYNGHNSVPMSCFGSGVKSTCVFEGAVAATEQNTNVVKNSIKVCVWRRSGWMDGSDTGPLQRRPPFMASVKPTVTVDLALKM